MNPDSRAGKAGRGDRTIWILTHRRVGDLRQMEQLAAALGWRTIVKKLAFRPPNVPFLARLLFDRKRSDPLEPPWPDLVLCGEALTSVIARLIGRRSKGAAKIVCLGRPAGTPERFDLVLTTPQYHLPNMPQVVELALPLATHADKGPGDQTGLPDFGKSPRPFSVVLVGGTALPEVLDEKAARTFAHKLLDHAGNSGGTLMVITSPRTGKAAGEILARAIPAPHHVHLWHGAAGNPYRHILSLADEVIVTSDSISMTADALAAGKPVSIYRLPQRRTLASRTVERLHAFAWGRTNGEGGGPWLKPVKWLFDNGIVEVRPNRGLLFNRLVAEGCLVWFGEAPAEQRTRPVKNGTEHAVAQIERLFNRAVCG